MQYRSSGGTGNPTGVTPLSGSIASHATVLVGEGTASGATGAALPTPDVSGSISMAATGGTIFLAAQTGPLTSPAVGSHVNDPLVVQTPAEVDWRPGQQVKLSARPERIHLFDNDTGDRIT